MRRSSPTWCAARSLAPAALLAAAALAGACRESLDGGAGCAGAAALCPGQTLTIHDTLIDPALVFDSTYEGFPTRGAELEIPLATRGDTIETVAVVRFDTLATFYIPPGDTSRVITRVDSSRVRLILGLTGARLPDSVRFELYDVDVADTTVADTAWASQLALFRADRRIGGATFAKANVKDTTFLPISDSVVLAKITDSAAWNGHLRIGIRVDGTGPVSLRLRTVESGAPAQLSYRPNLDTAARSLLTNDLASATPSGRADLRRDLLDYGLVVRNTIPDFPLTMSVGGVPGRRAYLRFNLPRRLTDSTTVIRATLRLTQRPVPVGDRSDTLTVFANVVLASSHVTDNRRAASLLAVTGLLVTDSLQVVPRDSGQRVLEMFDLVRAWGAQGSLADPPPRAVVLRTFPEGALPLQAAFWSSTAAPGLRPSLRLTYIPRTTFGIP